MTENESGRNVRIGRNLEGLQKRMMIEDALHDKCGMQRGAAPTVNDDTTSDVTPFEGGGVRDVLEQAREELGHLIGMDEVIGAIAALKSRVLDEQEKKRGGRESEGSDEFNRVVLSGPPGTGKTTIARVLARMYYECGVVSNDVPVVVTRKDLIGRYEGWTTEMTRKVIGRARGGVLIIDDAHDLKSRENGSDPDDHRFVDEFVSQLLMGVTNERNNLVVIFAGQERGLQGLFDVNRGMRSRFNHWITFAS